MSPLHKLLLINRLRETRACKTEDLPCAYYLQPSRSTVDHHLLDAVVVVDVHPRNDVRQLCGVVEHNDVIIERQMHVRQAPIIKRRPAEWQLACAAKAEEIQDSLEESTILHNQLEELLKAPQLPDAPVAAKSIC